MRRVQDQSHLLSLSSGVAGKRQQVDVRWLRGWPPAEGKPQRAGTGAGVPRPITVTDPVSSVPGDWGGCPPDPSRNDITNN